MTSSSALTRQTIAQLGPFSRRVIAVLLVFIVGPCAPLLNAAAQTVPAAPLALHITILDGEDALNSIRERTAREPIVQVEDENHKPVAGALVLFSINNGSEGAGGTFAGGANTLSVTTNSEGRAIAHGLLPNKQPGKYTISASATVGAIVVTTIIHQANALAAAAGATSSSASSGAAGSGGGTAGTTVVTGAASTTGAAAGTTASTSGGAVSTSATPESSNTPEASASSSIGHKISRLGHLPKKFYIAGGTVVVVGTVLGVTLTQGASSTSITAGTGTVGAPSIRR